MRRVTARWCGAALAVVGLALTVERAALASEEASPGSPLIEGTSTCPEPRAVWSALTVLIGASRLEDRLHTLPGAAPPVGVTDLGTIFRVRAGDQSREYEDGARDCANRAKLAALFVALAVDSVEQIAQAKASAAAPTPSPAPAVARREPAPLPPPERVAYLEIGVDGRFGVEQSTAAPGGLVRVSGGRGPYALVVGLRGSAPAESTMAGVRLRQWRAAADLAVRARLLRERSVTPFVELGAVVALLSEQAPDLASESARLAGELGVLVGGGLDFHRRTWGSAFFLVEAEIDPDPPTLSALPTGSLGRTPYVWLGAAAGLTLGLF